MSFQSQSKGTRAVTCPWARWARDTCHSALTARQDTGLPRAVSPAAEQSVLLVLDAPICTCRCRMIPTVRLSMLLGDLATILSCSQAMGGWKSLPTASKHPTRLVKTVQQVWHGQEYLSRPACASGPTQWVSHVPRASDTVCAAKVHVNIVLFRSPRRNSSAPGMGGMRMWAELNPRHLRGHEGTMSPHVASPLASGFASCKMPVK